LPVTGPRQPRTRLRRQPAAREQRGQRQAAGVPLRRGGTDGRRPSGDQAVPQDGQAVGELGTEPAHQRGQRAAKRIDRSGAEALPPAPHHDRIEWPPQLPRLSTAAGASDQQIGLRGLRARVVGTRRQVDVTPALHPREVGLGPRQPHELGHRHPRLADEAHAVPPHHHRDEPRGIAGSGGGTTHRGAASDARTRCRTRS
jgi:hypothetical protein